MPYNVSISPWASGTQPVVGNTNSPDLGICRLSQSASIAFNATLVSQVEIFIPPGAKIQSFDIDVLTVFNSASSATFSAGITSGATTYVSGVDVHSATGRIAPTYTAAQLAAMSNQSLVGVAAPTVSPLFLTITSVGQPTAGYVQVTVNYIQLSTPN
jgi:hypothetical protein